MANYVLVFEELVTVTGQDLHVVGWPDFNHQLEECGLPTSSIRTTSGEISSLEFARSAQSLGVARV